MPETATVQIPMPEMGESVTEGIVLEWHVAEGDSVKEGDTIVEVSTDKVDAEVPAPMDGVITKIVAQVDDEVPVGAPLAEMEAGEGSSEGQGAGAAGPAAAGDPPSPATTQETVPPTTSPTAGASNGGSNGGGDVRATPLARRVAEANGVDLASVAGSGPGAKVTKDDVLSADGGGNGATAAPAQGEAKQLRGAAAMLANAMDESRAVPTATSPSCTATQAST